MRGATSSPSSTGGYPLASSFSCRKVAVGVHIIVWQVALAPARFAALLPLLAVIVRDAYAVALHAKQEVAKGVDLRFFRHNTARRENLVQRRAKSPCRSSPITGG